MSSDVKQSCPANSLGWTEEKQLSLIEIQKSKASFINRACFNSYMLKTTARRERIGGDNFFFWLQRFVIRSPL